MLKIIVGNITIAAAGGFLIIGDLTWAGIALIFAGLLKALTSNR